MSQIDRSSVLLLLRGQISNLARIWLLAFALSISALAEPPSHTNPLRYVDQKAAAGCALINKADEAVDVYDALARRTLSTVAFHTGQNLPGDVLSLIGKKDPARVALGMLNAAQNYQTNPDYFDIDRGQFMAVLGEVFTHLVKDKKAKAITEKVRRFLTKGVTYLDEHPEVVKAFEEGDDAAISQSVNSLFASVAARARGDLQNKLEKRLFETQERLMTAKEWQQIARLKTPKVAELLLLAPVDERDAYLKTYLNNMVNEKTGLQPELIPLLQELSRSPSTQKMANNILANFGLAGNKDIRKGRLGQGLLGLKDDFLKRGADTLKLLQDLAPDLADAAHVALSL